MKIGILTSNKLSNFRLATLNPLLNDGNFSLKLALINNSPKRTLLQRLILNIKKGRGGYILIMIFKSLFSNKQTDLDTKEFCIRNCIKFIETKEPYSHNLLKKISEYNLDILILVGGFGIIKKPLLDITPLGVLSYHHGDMRKYRGMPPALWELYNNEKEMGITVQILKQKLDSGIPIEEKKIRINKNDTLEKLRNRAYEASIEMLYNSLKKINNKDFKPIVIKNFGEIYTLPNLRQWLTLNIKILFRKINHYIYNNFIFNIIN